MAQADFLPAYLIVGSDALKREFVIKRLRDRIAKLGDLDFNQDVLVGPATNADTLMAACNALPFMSEYRLVYVKEAQRLPKAASEAIITYLQDPSPSTVLALEAAALAKNTRLYKAVAKLDKKAVISCDPKKARELPAQVRDFATSHRVTISQDAAIEIISLVGDSTLRLDSEIQKMATALGPGAVIDSKQIARFVTRSAEAKPWPFLDALCARDVKRSLALLANLHEQSPHGLLALSVGRLRELLTAKDARYASSSALAAALGKADWQVKNHLRWARAFAPGELEHALMAAAELEFAMKSGGDASALFERWVIQVCTPCNA